MSMDMIQKGNIGKSALILGAVSAVCTSILVLVAETGNLEAMPPWLGHILGVIAGMCLFIVMIQVVVAMAKKREYLIQTLIGFFLALIPYIYALLEAMSVMPPAQ